MLRHNFTCNRCGSTFRSAFAHPSCDDCGSTDVSPTVHTFTAFDLKEAPPLTPAHGPVLLAA